MRRLRYAFCRNCGCKLLTFYAFSVLILFLTYSVYVISVLDPANFVSSQMKFNVSRLFGCFAPLKLQWREVVHDNVLNKLE